MFNTFYSITVEYLYGPVCSDARGFSKLHVTWTWRQLVGDTKRPLKTMKIEIAMVTVKRNLAVSLELLRVSTIVEKF